jgi:hypothetical protein
LLAFLKIYANLILMSDAGAELPTPPSPPEAKASSPLSSQLEVSLIKPTTAEKSILESNPDKKTHPTDTGLTESPEAGEKPQSPEESLSPVQELSDELGLPIETEEGEQPPLKTLTKKYTEGEISAEEALQELQSLNPNLTPEQLSAAGIGLITNIIMKEENMSAEKMDDLLKKLNEDPQKKEEYMKSNILWALYFLCSGVYRVWEEQIAAEITPKQQ